MRKPSPYGCQGFTLVEMLAVMAIMLVMMGIATGSFVDWSRGAGMRGATLNVSSTISLTRQQAVTQRQRAMFVYGNTNMPRLRGYYYIADKVSGKAIGTTNLLPEGIAFTNPPDNDVFANYIEYRTEGTCRTPGGDNISPTKLGIIETRTKNGASGSSNIFEVMPMTGTVRVKGK